MRTPDSETGAQAGISLLWLVIIGCVIKVFVQIELGRYTIGNGETTLTALNKVPGPRLRVNWVVWYWLVMMLVGFGQLGGIIGGVGQSLALAIPIKGDYAEAIRIPSDKEMKSYIAWNTDIETGGHVFETLTEDQKSRVERSNKVIQGRLDKLDAEDGDGTSEKLITLVSELIEAENNKDEAEIARLKKEVDAMTVDVPMSALTA